jgi:Sel1 repeat
VSPPLRLRDLNYILFHADPKTPGSGFGTGLTKLVAALNTDFDWLREHTRYLQRATEWDRGGRPANRLLSGDDIAEAKAWAARRPKSAPEPTPLHLDFIRASEGEAEARSSAQRKQLEEMAAAQAEREKALKKAEVAQRKRARMIYALVVVGIFTLLTGWLYLHAEQQRRQAELQGRQTEMQHAKQMDEFQASLTRLQDISKDVEKDVIRVFMMAAQHGDAPSMRYIGWFYQNGFGVGQDDAKARAWYEAAANNGDEIAKSRLEQLRAASEAAVAGREAPQR